MFLPFFAHAQRALPGGFEHVIEVARFDNWGKHYLTITDPGEVKFSHDKKNWTTENVTYEYVGDSKDNKENRIEWGELIIEVNGVSAKDWTAEKFYQKVDGNREVITLKIRKRDNSTGIRDFVTQIRPRYDIHKDLEIFGDAISAKAGLTYAQDRARQPFNYEERNDIDFDFFYCRFYDYKLVSDDPLLDKELIKEMGMMEHNEEQPDVFLTVKKSASTEQHLEHVAATYQTHKVYGVTKMVSPDYNRVATRIDTYLEITAFDAKKMKEGETENLPVIWKGIAKRSSHNGNYDTTKELKAYASWMTMPIFDRKVNLDGVLYAPVGVTVGTDPSVIESVQPGSRAYMLGLQPGDRIVDVEPLSNWSGSLKKTFKNSLKTKGWKAFEDRGLPGSGYKMFYMRNWKYTSADFIAETYRLKVTTQNGEKMTLVLKPVSINLQRNYVAQ